MRLTCSQIPTIICSIPKISCNRFFTDLYIYNKIPYLFIIYKHALLNINSFLQSVISIMVTLKHTGDYNQYTMLFKIRQQVYTDVGSYMQLSETLMPLLGQFTPKLVDLNFFLHKYVYFIQKNVLQFTQLYYFVHKSHLHGEIYIVNLDTCIYIHISPDGAWGTRGLWTHVQ